MNHYTVIHPSWIDDELADLWLASKDRNAISAASNLIDRELRVDAENKGVKVVENLRRLEIGPLWVYFTVHPDDCFVKLWSVRLAKS